MKKVIIMTMSLILVGVIWIAYNTSKNTKENNNKALQASVPAVSQESPKKESDAKPQEETKNSQADGQTYTNWSSGSSQAVSPFPSPSVENIGGGVMQRTIHMGVRQWEWVPEKITANYGDKIILIMHNADVTHSISIPDLNVKQDIPDDGAVVQFKAAKRGTFTFFCDTPCGEGHNRMRGEITIT